MRAQRNPPARWRSHGSARSARSSCSGRVSRSAIIRCPITPTATAATGPRSPTFTIGADWPSGYYDILLTDAAGESRASLRLRQAGPRQAARESGLRARDQHLPRLQLFRRRQRLLRRRLADEPDEEAPEAMEGGIGVLSTLRPFAPAIVAAPADVPRLVTSRKRGFQRKAVRRADARRLALRSLGRLPEQVGACLRALGRGGRPRAGLLHRLRSRRRARSARSLWRADRRRPQRILVGAPARLHRGVRRSRRQVCDLLRQHRVLEGALRRRRQTLHLSQVARFRERSRCGTRSAGGDAPVVAQDVCAAGSRRSPG